MPDLARGPGLDERRRSLPARQREIESRAGSVLGAPRPRRSLDAGSVLGLQRSVGNLATTAYIQRLELQRHAGHGDEENLQLELLQRTAAQTAELQREDEDGAGGAETSPVHNAIARSGSPVDSSVRSVVEPMLQTSLSDVQVVPDRDSTASVSASAYTVGNKVVVNPDRFSAGTPQAQRTLFHEMAHVKQQREGPVAGTPQAGGIQVSSPEDRFEQEAERFADRAMGMQRQTVTQAERGRSSGGEDLASGGELAAVQRAEEDEEEAEA
ncbi:MAG TPA: DUF4157 domain-containing protein [Acidimicrobiales bacterium]|nr:DUF4157 domain-containing protein [Acidimicrobiales bacterium]